MHTLNRRGAQVFIATTNGLVQVQSIVRLTNPDLHSVVTIGNTSQLAGISRLYQDYVDQPQGLISEIFSGNAYRLNLSKGIDQGESWQLGVFIAHYLFEYDCLSDGLSNTSNAAGGTNNDTSTDDIIFIATGRVDTLHYHVLPIEELAKKCLHANPYITQWQSLQYQICFLAPTQNFRQPVPNSLLKLSPIADLRELSQLCSLFELPTKALFLPDAIGLTGNAEIESVYATDDNNQSVIIEANLIEEAAVNIDYVPNDQGKIYGKHHILSRLPLFLYTLIGAIFVWSLVSLIVSFSTNDELELQSDSRPNIHEHAIEYIVVGDISQNKASCLSAENILISQGVFALNIHSNATNLDNLCDLFVVTSPQVKSLWLVSDTQAIIDLVGVEINQETTTQNGLSTIKQMLSQYETLIQWAVPLPKNQKQTRRFTVLAFLKSPDAADMSSLDSYLFQLHQQGKYHNMGDLQLWIDKTQSASKVFMLEQELTIYR